MAPIEGVIEIQGDITCENVVELILELYVLSMSC